MIYDNIKHNRLPIASTNSQRIFFLIFFYNPEIILILNKLNWNRK